MQKNCTRETLSNVNTGTQVNTSSFFCGTVGIFWFPNLHLTLALRLLTGVQKWRIVTFLHRGDIPVLAFGNRNTFLAWSHFVCIWWGRLASYPARTSPKLPVGTENDSSPSRSGNCVNRTRVNHLQIRPRRAHGETERQSFVHTATTGHKRDETRGGWGGVEVRELLHPEVGVKDRAVQEIQ